MVLQPLTTLIANLTHAREFGALVVTMKEHTTCYLATERGHLYHFDPLPAMIKDITTSWDQMRFPHVEYSGLLLHRAMMAM